MTNGNTKPTHPSPTIPEPFLVHPDKPRDTLANTLQVVCLVDFIAHGRLDNMSQDAQWGLQRMLQQINQALWYEIERNLATVEEYNTRPALTGTGQDLTPCLFGSRVQ